MTNQITEILLGFDEERWTNYLQQLCYDLKPYPSLKSISLTRIGQLFWIYNELNERNKESLFLFTKSLLHLFRTVDPQETNIKLINEIIYFIHETRPTEHRKLIELLIRDESFINLKYGRRTLHFLLIKAYTYIEVGEKLYLEEYLINNSQKNEPYFLYLMMNYYCHWGYNIKALDSLFKVFNEGRRKLNEDFCKEIYHSLTDFIPQYVDITVLLEYLIDKEIKIDHENSCLSGYIKKFIDNLKLKTELALALFAEDVLNNNLDNYLEKYDEIGKLAERRNINSLIVRYTHRFLQSKAAGVSFSTSGEIEQLMNETITKDDVPINQPVQDYNTVA